MGYSTSKERNAFIRSSGPDSFHCIRLFPGNNSESFTANGHVTGRLPAKIMLTIVWLMPNCFDMCFCLIFIMREDYHPIISLSMIFFIVCNIFFDKGFAMIIAKGYKRIMKNRRLAFSRALQHFIKAGKNITQTKIAAKTGIKQGMVSGMKTGKRWGTEENRRAIADYFNKSYDEFLDIGQALLDAENSIIKNDKPADSPNIHRLNDIHEDVIKMFQDKKTALEINQILVQIEQAGPDKLAKAKRILALHFEEDLDATKKRIASNGTA
jgi:transcriptional regulator with XRE-family HTH domain